MEILSCYACIPLIKIICTPDMTYGSTERIILSFWPIFCPFTPLTAQKLKILKMKKNPGDVIILHKCTKSHDHPLYCSGDVAWDGCNCYFSFWAIFCPFNHLTNRKKKLSKKKQKKPEQQQQQQWQQQKQPGDIILHKCTKNQDHMLYWSWDIWSMTDVIIFCFELFCALLPR